MKKAKVKDGVVYHVWPWIKTLPDGTSVVKQCPYLNRDKPLPDCIVDVPDTVKPGYVWNGKKYAKRVKIWPTPKRDPLLEEIAERLGTTLDELKAAAKTRKNAV